MSTLRAALAIALAALGLPGCRGTSERFRSEVLLASTTSTEDSGLFDVLIPLFQRANPDLRVRVVAVGSGQALELGRRRDADVLLVHAPTAEEEFMRQRHGVERRPVMRNEFVIVGPRGDPAHVRGAGTAAEGFRRIARAETRFISRGDDSGTHRRELAIWKVAGLEPRDGWYLEAGQGMGEVLTLADELRSYTLTDTGTYWAMKKTLALEILLGGDPILDNPYHVITVTGARNPDGGQRFAEWITGREAQALIDTFGIGQFGRPLFRPTAR